MNEQVNGPKIPATEKMPPDRTTKTSTGLPIDQSYTPPMASSTRRSDVLVPQKNVFAGVFPGVEESKRPASATIGKPLDDVYALLRDVQNFPKFFESLEKVESSDASTARWQFKGQAAIPMKLQSDMKGNTLVWKSEDAAGFHYTLAIHLEKAQANRGTVVRIMTAYDDVLGKLAGGIEKVFGKDPAMNAKINLQRFKAFCETGHVPTIEGQPSGRDADSHILSGHENQTLKH